MHQRRYPVLVETPRGHLRAGFSSPATEEPVCISLKLRDQGWSVYRVRFDMDLGKWVASVIDSKRAA